jgi:hypothetical protein
MYRLLLEITDTQETAQQKILGLKIESEINTGDAAKVAMEGFASKAKRAAEVEEDPEAELKRQKREQDKILRDAKAEEKRKNEQEAELAGTTDYRAKAKLWLGSIKSFLAKTRDTMSMMRAKGIKSASVTTGLKTSWEDLKSYNDKLDNALMTNMVSPKLKALIQEVNPVIEQCKDNLAAALKACRKK